MDKKELVFELKQQHRLLEQDLIAGTESDDPQEIVILLNKFKEDLVTHLGLENNTFYQDYLKRQSETGGDVSATKNFMAQMDDIAKAVIAFLTKYDSPEKISSLDAFRKDLAGIIETLKLRIESEEEGVYEVYLAL